MKRVLILAEGQTEKRFVTDVLAPHLEPRGVVVIPKIVVTGKTFDGTQFQGGIRTFAQVQSSLRPLFNDSAAAMFTTLIDFYGLPTDFPGWKAVQAGSAQKRVRQLEAALAAHFDNPRFRPFLMLHEYEAMVFVQPKTVAQVLNRPELEEDLREIRAEFLNPEDINNDRATAPSKRLLALHPAYRKRQHGVEIVRAVGLEKIRAVCPHFNGWLEALESLSED